MTGDRKKSSHKALARDDTKKIAVRRMRSDKPNVREGWMDETELLEMLIDEHEAETGVAKGKQNCAR